MIAKLCCSVEPNALEIKPEARAGLFGSFFDNLALDAETIKLTPLLYDNWKDKCDAQLQGLTLTPIGNNLYYFYDRASTTSFANWYQARAFCNQRGMDLASLETSQEHTLFLAYITKLLGPAAADDTSAYWIGLNSLATANSWVWPTTGATPNYLLYWLSGEPDTPASKFCVDFRKATGVVGFADDLCSAFLKFVCEVQSPCREVLLLRYYLSKKFNILNDIPNILDLFNNFDDKNFENIVFNNNFNTITGK